MRKGTSWKMASKSRIHITGGQFRGRSIPSPRSTSTRPTPAILREAIFNILQERVVGAGVLELFAGVGTLGFEALSRGAAFATFVEREKSVADLIRETAQRLGCEDRAEVLAIDVFRDFDILEERPYRYSLVFLDPPYALSRDIRPGTRMHELIELLATSPVVEDGALGFLQHPRKADIRLELETIEFRETRPYGSTAVTLFAVNRTRQPGRR